MSSSLRKVKSEELDPKQRAPASGTVRRSGSAIGLATISVLDLLAIE